MRRVLSLAAATALLLGALPSTAAVTPPALRVGQCVTTTVTDVSGRLEGMPDSGTSIGYANGLWQVSYDVDPGAKMSRKGDSVKLCLVSLPTGCPKGDDRGKIYNAINLRTHKSWQMPDSEHMCGGA